MSVTVHREGKTVTASLKGEIDHHTACALRETIDDAVLTARGADCLVLDFSGVTFMDSSGVGLVMGRSRLTEGRGWTLRAVNLSPREYRIMAMSGIDKIAEITQRSRVPHEKNQ